ncbi:MAG: DUF2341 domain-containing protein [Candidatus Thorarchaeota archaeon]|nr:DUF2341 domain-containing protein [Candidatus Thorarchaeota archaeon]
MKSISEKFAQKAASGFSFIKRKRLGKVLLSGILICVLVVPVAAREIPPPGGTKYYVNGYVKDTAGNPISGAAVKLYKDGITYINTAYTTTSGYFTISTLLYSPPDFWQVRVTKSGYEPATKTVECQGTTTSMGTVYMTSAAPPVMNPTIGIPNHVRETPYQAKIEVTVGWHYDPYISRVVWLEWGVGSGQFFTMQPVGGLYTKTLTGLNPSDVYDYRIKATEVFFDPGADVNREATSYSSTYNIASWPTPNLTGMTHMKRHEVIGSQGAGANYQIRLTVHYGEGSDDGEHVFLDGANNNVDPSLDAIRFTTGDGLAELPYWREVRVAGDYAVFWVRMYENLDEDIEFRMYFGPAGIPTASSGLDTFLFFDDFGLERETYTWTNIATGSGSASYALQNGELHFDLEATSDGATYGYDLWSDRTWSTTSFAMYAKARWTGLDDYRGYTSFLLPGFLDRNDHYTSWLYQLYGDYRFRTACVVDNSAIDTNNPSDTGDSEGNMEVYYYINGDYYDLTVDGEYDERKTGTSATGLTAPFRVRLYSAIQSRPYSLNSLYNTYVDTFFDTVYVRKWVPNEPSHGSWGDDVYLGFHDDCSSYTEWNSYFNKFTDYVWDWRFPVLQPWHGNLIVGTAGGDDYLYYGSGSPAPSGKAGTSFRIPLDASFMLTELDCFKVKIGRELTVPGATGELHLLLYDDHKKPIVDIRMMDLYDYNSQLFVDALHYDRNLDITAIPLKVGIMDAWTGEITIWYEPASGLMVHLDGTQILADSQRVDLQRRVAYVAIQPIREGINDKPDLRVYDIRVTPEFESQDIDWNRARGYRSGPNDVPITEPGPSNEIQLFPQSGDGKLKFKFHPEYWTGNARMIMDIRPLRLEDTDAPPDINVVVKYPGMSDDIEPGQHQANWEPNYDYLMQMYNYIQIWDFYIYGGDDPIVVEVDVHGAGWSPVDLVAFRAIWVCRPYDNYYYDLEQIIPDSGYLTYYVPMGEDAKLDLGWSGSGMMNVYVDDSLKQSKSEGSYIDLDLGQDYVRDTLHKVRLGAAAGSTLSTMHFHHMWMSIEVDWIDGYEPPDLPRLESFLESYYRQHTHGRIDFVIDEAVPYGGPLDSSADLVYIGQIHNGGYFQHRNDRTWFYQLYIPISNVPGGGLCWDSDGANQESWWSPNGWKFWTGCDVEAYWPPYLNPAVVDWWMKATMHEFGHRAHQVGDADVCETTGCVMGGSAPDNYPLTSCNYCNYHWFQTWMNIDGATWGLGADWWLL